MVQANELRIGVCLLVCGQITEISSGFIADYDFSHRHNFSNNTPIARDSVYPIPLTVEILEKAGFTERRNGWIKEYEDGCLFTLNKVGERLEFTSHKPKIKYLHQLQNLYFALTGEELQIKL